MIRVITKKNVWVTFSEYIRKRDADWRGNCECISCGTTKHWKEMDAGHFIHNTNACYFNELNVNAQCGACNRFKHGNLHYYKRNLENKIGTDAVKDLMDTKWVIHRFTKKELKEVYKYCKDNMKDV